jgi:hypothetical protein
VHPVDGTQDFRATREAGIYRVLAGDSLLELVAVNPPISESLLATADIAAVAQALGGDLRVIEDPEIWNDAVFAQRQGRELWRPLLLAVLLLLLGESWAAASGAAAGRADAHRPGPEPAVTASAH